MTLFNFGRNNRLSTCGVVSDDDYGLLVGYWVSGRILGRYVSVTIPWKSRVGRSAITVTDIEGEASPPTRSEAK